MSFLESAWCWTAVSASILLTTAVFYVIIYGVSCLVVSGLAYAILKTKQVAKRAIK